MLVDSRRRVSCAPSPLCELLEGRRLLAASGYTYFEGVEYGPSPGMSASWSRAEKVLTPAEPTLTLTITAPPHAYVDFYFRMAVLNANTPPGDADPFTVTLNGSQIHSSDAAQTDLEIQDSLATTADESSTYTIVFSAPGLEPGGSYDDEIMVVDTFLNVYTPEVSVVAWDATAGEGVTPDKGRFRFSRAGAPSDVPLTASFSMSGDAILNTDYTLQPGGTSVTFGVGETEKLVDLVPVADAKVEGEETATATVLTGANYLSAGGPASVVIQKSDLDLEYTDIQAAGASNTKPLKIASPGTGTFSSIRVLENGSEVAATLTATAPAGITAAFTLKGSGTYDVGVTVPAAVAAGIYMISITTVEDPAASIFVFIEI